MQRDRGRQKVTGRYVSLQKYNLKKRCCCVGHGQSGAGRSGRQTKRRRKSGRRMLWLLSPACRGRGRMVRLATLCRCRPKLVLTLWPWPVATSSRRSSPTASCNPTRWSALARRSGAIEKLDVKVGDVVKAGDLIAEIDPARPAECGEDGSQAALAIANGAACIRNRRRVKQRRRRSTA